MYVNGYGVQSLDGIDIIIMALLVLVFIHSCILPLAAPKFPQSQGLGSQGGKGKGKGKVRGVVVRACAVFHM